MIVIFICLLRVICILIIDISCLPGGPLDLMSRRVLCAGTEQLAKQVSDNIEQLELERD